MNGTVHVGREDKKVKQHNYNVPSSQKLSHTSCALSCSLVYFISGLFADMGATVISRDSEVIKFYTGHGRGWDTGGKDGKKGTRMGEVAKLSTYLYSL